MATCGRCAAARTALSEAFRAVTRGDVTEAARKTAEAREQVIQKVRSESDRIRNLRIRK